MFGTFSRFGTSISHSLVLSSDALFDMVEVIGRHTIDGG